MTLFPLFELCKTLSVSRDDVTEVILSTYGEYGNRGILALVCNNGYLLLRQTSSITPKAVIKQIPWFKQSDKAIKVICFDSSASWLLVACADSSLYILPVLSYLGPAVKPSGLWRTDDLTEIKLQGQRGIPTSLCWWQTMCEKQIGIMGNEVGEICFINLKTRREIGGTYINTSVQSLHVLYNEKTSTSYLLISGTRKKHWQLLLEEKKSGFLWPGDSEAETKKEALSEKRTVFGERSPDEKQLDPRPQHLSQYDDRVFLAPQHARGRQLLTVHHPSSNILQVYESYFESPLLSSYRLPSDCRNIILADKLLFLTLPDNLRENTPRHKLKILSCQLSEVSGEGAKKREAYEAEVQAFSFPGEIISSHRKSSSVTCTDNLVKQLSDLSCHYDFPDDVTVKFATVTKSGKGIPRPSNINLKKNSHHFHKIENESGLKKDRERLSVVGKRKHSTLEKCFILENLISGFYIVTKHCVFECRPRVTPEKLFLSLTTSPADLPRAEHLGVMLSLDISYLYEVAADLQLANGQFAQAVRLYQLSKCPQLKRVANFISYGYLSELLAYVQVLFTTTITEVQAPDRVHFGNLAVHCFVQQILEKTGEKLAVVHAFRDFLRDNIYYNEDVAVRLLAEQHLYKHLHYCAKVRGQQTKMLQHLLNHEEHCLKVEEETRALLVSKGLANDILYGINDDYIQCITSPDLLQHLVSKPQLMRSHLERLAQFLARLRADQLSEIASLYDPSQPAARLAFRKILSSPQSQSFLSCSVSSLSSTSSEILDFVQGDEGTVTEEDMMKFFIFVLLLLNHKRGSRKFDMKLLQSDFRYPEEEELDIVNMKLRPEILVPKEEPLACGLAHAGYIRDGSLFMWGKSTQGRTGHGEEEEDVCLPQQVRQFETLRVKVLSVACGAYHTIALTDSGVFSWGSSRYGQLGLGELKQTTSPLLVESLAGEKIAAIACGQYHSLALTTDGRIYSWGWGVHGQLGLGNPEDQDHPILVKSLLDKQVITVAAGQGHTAILTKLGKVYTFGCGMFGQIGQGTLSKHCWPQHVDLPETVHILSSGYFHVIAVTITNKLYMWGCNPQVLRLQAQSSRRARQHSGVNRPAEISSSPVIPMGSSKQPSSSSRPTELSQAHLLPRYIDTSVVHGQIKQVACGSHHSVLLSTDGEVYSWGRNMEGQLGHGSRKEQKTPSMVLSLNDKKIVSISCGSDFTLAMDNRNKLWGWGQNDSGQLGHKSSIEGFVRPTLTTSTSASSGRVITIRTNRRMITITQGNRQGELRPVEITTIPEPSVDTHMDIDSFDISHSMPRIIHYYNSRIENFLCLPPLSKLDSPPYGPYALHATLKSFLHCCDVTTILNHCICFGDYQAAAKVYMLEGLYAQALEHQLKALSMEKKSSEEMLEEAVKIVQFYFQFVNQESTEANQHLLEQVILMWLEWKFPVESLESLLQDQLSVLCYPLGLLLFCGSVNESKSQKICTDFLSCLSPKFCLTVADYMLQNINAGKPHEELMDKMMALTGTGDLMHQINQADMVTGWEARIPPPQLWKEVLMNLQKGVISRNSIELSPNQVELLTRSLMNEQIQRPDVPPSFAKHSGIASHQSSASSSHDVVLFTCGHHYTRHVFRTSILPGFQDVVQKLPYALPQTMKQLMLCFESEGVIPSACPRCIVTEIKSEM